MDSQPEKTPLVRLKYFLARQIEKRGKGGGNITPQQAAVLASLMWTEEYCGRLFNQKELCRLLGIKSESQMTPVINSLERRGLVKITEAGTPGKFYRITDNGLASVAQFADEVLGIPKEVEGQMRSRSDYTGVIGGVIGVSDELIDDFLREHFSAAKMVRVAKQKP
jgi:DNA-binding MarR family transcriptional regulator